MKRVVLTLTVVLILGIMSGADIRRENVTPAAAPAVKKPCYGYTIIEFGKGINCHGDTVKLVKVNGGQQLAVEENAIQISSSRVPG